MALPVFSPNQLMMGSTQSVSLGTASATSSTALPAKCSGVRITAGCAIWFNFNASASAGAGSYLPAATVEYVQAPAGGFINILAETSANPMRCNITPIVAQNAL